MIVYNVMSLDICKHSYHHHSQGHRHVQHLPASLCPLVMVVVLVSW